MPSSDELFQCMAEDIGLQRYRGEPDFDYHVRIAYAGARHWISAFCMDDGADGTLGLTRQILNRRLKRWVDGLDNAIPGLKAWFEGGRPGLSAVYGRLINIGEIVPNGFTDRYLAQPAHLLPVGTGQSLIIGMYDPTDLKSGPQGSGRDDRVATGLTSIVSTVDSPRSVTRHWWETEWDLLKWNDSSQYGEIEYASPEARSWVLSQGEVWSGDARWVEGMAIARSVANAYGGTSCYAVRRSGRRQLICPIEITKAYELYYHIRSAVRNPVIARLRWLDEKHVHLAMPLGLISGDVNRVLEVVTWPVRNVSDPFSRISRSECVPLVRELLSHCDVTTKEV